MNCCPLLSKQLLLILIVLQSQGRRILLIHCFSFSNNANGNSMNGKSFDTTTTTNSDSDRILRIAFVTGNAMKLKEVESLLLDYANTHSPEKSSYVALHTLKIDLPEIQEVDTMAIAKNKALLAGQLVNGPCLVEDTSLHFNALGGMPGPYIKWFQDKLKCDGLYNILAAYNDKSATAVCTLAFSPAPYSDPILFTGECHGQIIKPEPNYINGFGWDSIFVPDEEFYGLLDDNNNDDNNNDNNNSNNNNTRQAIRKRRPFSQMTVEEKNSLSHRGKAVRKLAKWIGRNQDALYRRQQGEKAIGHQGLSFIETAETSVLKNINHENDNIL